jgi:hypothetical protein
MLVPFFNIPDGEVMDLTSSCVNRPTIRQDIMIHKMLLESFISGDRRQPQVEVFDILEDEDDDDY